MAELAHTGERSGEGKSSHLMTQNHFYLCLCVSGAFIYLFCSYLNFLRPTGKFGTLYHRNARETRSLWEPFSFLAVQHLPETPEKMHLTSRQLQGTMAKCEMEIVTGQHETYKMGFFLAEQYISRLLEGVI